MSDETLKRLRALTATLNERFGKMVGMPPQNEIRDIGEGHGIALGYTDANGSLFVRGSFITYEEDEQYEPSAVIVHSSYPGYTPSVYVLFVPDDDSVR
jgi:hypothetical protein